MASLIDESLNDSLFNDFSLEQNHKRNTYCYVYCAPCWLSVWTAYRICKNECWERKSTSMTWRIRIDDRLDIGYSYAHPDLRCFLSMGNLDQCMLDAMDLNHIRRRLYALDRGEAVLSDLGGFSTILKEHKRDTNCAALVLLTTVDTYRLFDSLPGYVIFPRRPEEREVYQYRWNQDTQPTLREPVFLGTYQHGRCESSSAY